MLGLAIRGQLEHRGSNSALRWEVVWHAYVSILQKLHESRISERRGNTLQEIWEDICGQEIWGKEAVKKLVFASGFVEDLRLRRFVRGGVWLASRTSGWLSLGNRGFSGLSGRSR
jgi:hypothetical protein